MPSAGLRVTDLTPVVSRVPPTRRERWAGEQRRLEGVAGKVKDDSR